MQKLVHHIHTAKTRNTQMPISWKKLDFKKIIWFHHRKELIFDTYYIMDESKKHYNRWKANYKGPPLNASLL